MSEFRAALRELYDSLNGCEIKPFVDGALKKFNDAGSAAAALLARPDSIITEANDYNAPYRVGPDAPVARPEPSIDCDRLSLIRQTVADCEKFSRDGATWGASADIKFLLSVIAAKDEWVARPEPVIDSYAGDQPRGVFTNTGYHGTACGFIVRDGSLWSVTFKTHQDADDYVAWKNSRPDPEPRLTREEARRLLDKYKDACANWDTTGGPYHEEEQAYEACLAAMGVKQ